MLTGAPRIERDIEYACRDGQPLLLDAFLPPVVSGKAPGIVVVHGGRWSQQDKRALASESAALALEGFAVFPINYRMYNGMSALPSQLQNVRTAIRWIRANADRFGVDANRIALFGGSAGGHLSALAALEADPLDPDNRITAVAIWSGFFDLEKGYAEMARKAEVTAIEIALGGTPDECGPKYHKYSPINHVTAHAPPMLISVSTREVSPLKDSEAFVHRLKEAQVPCEFIILEGNAHMREYAPLVWQQTSTFLKQHLKPEQRG